MRQLSFNDRLAPQRAGAASRPGGRPRIRTSWLRLLRRRARLLGVLAAGVAVLSTASWWLVQPGNAAELGASVRHAFMSTTAGIGMTVENVYSTGHREADPAVILAALEIKRGDPILAFAPERARTRLLALDWVESATIERRLPDTIRIQIVERQAFALWQHEQRLQIVDRKGSIINSEDVPRFGHLPLIVGSGAPHHAPALFDTMSSAPTILRGLVSAVRVGSRRWDLHFESGLTVHLPESGAAQAWQRLVRLLGTYDTQEERIVSIDLRLPDRVVLGKRPEETIDGSST
ncbi:MAG: cell division protein FtsQ/DivIB [Proteobacteria bacterium]|nr:cell division protein FtsQ/DivIB [Pseudomonadota bacterium]MDA1357168.1 cell division protein FtsQ/DivIB [Pseudomonadota bacterium]